MLSDVTGTVTPRHPRGVYGFKRLRDVENVMAVKTESLILSFVAILIGVVLIEPIQDVVSDANITGIAGTIVSLIPLFFGIGIVLNTVRGMISG